MLVPDAGTGKRGSDHFQSALSDGERNGIPHAGNRPRTALALDGGTDGLDFYRLFTEHYAVVLHPGGWLVLEIGCAQADEVLALGSRYGWQYGRCCKDYGGNDRVIVLQKPEKIR